MLRAAQAPHTRRSREGYRLPDSRARLDYRAAVLSQRPRCTRAQAGFPLRFSDRSLVGYRAATTVRWQVPARRLASAGRGAYSAPIRDERQLARRR
jgi:hypothetical protein